LRGLDRSTYADNLHLKSLARETRHLSEFVGRLKSIKDGGQSQIENTIECKHMDTHGKYDTNMFIPAAWAPMSPMTIRSAGESD